MKNLFIALLSLSISSICVAQQNEYAVSSYLKHGPKAPNTNYIGEAYLNGLLTDTKDIDYNITKATFKANSTLDWHTHSSPQILIYVDGEGYYQERGKEAVILKAGDVIKCDKGVEHWHSSTKESDVTYLAIYGGEQPTVWTEKLSQKYYDSIAKKLNQK